jgi:hypothetical protein
MSSSQIQIDSELHAELRDYCDQCGIRFVDFVEDALAQAVAIEAILDKSEKADQMLNRATEDRRQSFRHGFHVGMVAGIFAGQGKLGVSRDCTPPGLFFKHDPNKVVSGSQLLLFE